jgi:peptide/nickel transport system permease protein
MISEEKTKAQPVVDKDAIAVFSQWQLIRMSFAKHKLAVIALFVLIVLYILAIFCEFFSPYTTGWKELDYAYVPPQPPQFSFTHGLHITGTYKQIDPITFKHDYIENKDDIVPLGFFVKGEPYKLWGLVSWDRHFLGVNQKKYREMNPDRDASLPTPAYYLLGADKYGRDIFSRLLHGARISLSISVIAIVATFILGITIGGISGYLGGVTDTIIQRLIEIINSLPRLPLWLALGAAMPPEWSPIKTYFSITLVLALVGWCGLARTVRGKLLSLREEDYAVAAHLIGASHSRIIFRHLLPGFTSHIIVSLTMRVPTMIIGETSLSFLGLGLRPPVVSWGVMLQDCMNMQVVANYPWLLMPVVFIIMTVLSFNFLGDGMRDAADPYSAR